MPRNRLKNYAIHSTGNEPVSIAEFRNVPWQQRYKGVNFDFRRWLYVGRPKLDEQGCSIPDEHGLVKDLVYAGRDGVVEAIRDVVWNTPAVNYETKSSYCRCGINTWFEYLDWRDAAGQPICDLTEIDKEVIWGYIYWLRDTKESATDCGRLGNMAAKVYYQQTKHVLNYLSHNGALPEGLFPRNPFPNSSRSIIGHKPYTKKVMTSLMSVLYKDVQGIRDGVLKLPHTQTLTVYLLLIAARTGRNPTPLLELTRDAVKEHPIKPDRLRLLLTFKRRSNKYSMQSFEPSEKLESMVSIPMDVLTLYMEAVSLTEPLVSEVPPQLKNQLWLYRRSGSGRGTKDCVDILTYQNYLKSAKLIIKRHDLRDDNGELLILNISRLRKTFAQRMWQLTGGDIIAVADQLGNTPLVAGKSYVDVTPEMKANFRRIGHIMHADWAGKLEDTALLAELSRETGIHPDQLKRIAVGDYNTGVGRCTDPLIREKTTGDVAFCTCWTECFFCQNQLVMESDLYRLYSFYYLLLTERNFISRSRWNELYGRIIHIIDHEIVAPNLRTKANPKGCFDPYRVEKCRAEAEVKPHPMWRDRAILGDIP
jgi:hypothetical protein